MSIFNLFRQPPPPEPFYKKAPIATAAVILTMIGMFVLGPIGYIWNGMTEELKKKVDNTTLQMMIQKDREAIARQTEELKEKDQKDAKQDAAIIENQKTLIMLTSPQVVPFKKKVEVEESYIAPKMEKKSIPPELFVKYWELKPEIQVKYKKYLEHQGYDVSGL
jgi:hypothetical protein